MQNININQNIFSKAQSSYLQRTSASVSRTHGCRGRGHTPHWALFKAGHGRRDEQIRIRERHEKERAFLKSCFGRVISVWLLSTIIEPLQLELISPGGPEGMLKDGYWVLVPISICSPVYPAWEFLKPKGFYIGLLLGTFVLEGQDHKMFENTFSSKVLRCYKVYRRMLL